MGPGNVDVTLNWGAERANPDTLGAVEFITLPSVVAPSISLALGPDCDASAGLLVGTCSLVATFDSAVPSGTTTIATFTAAYLWVPMDGYELCVSASDPGCVAANQLATLLANNISVFGEVPPVYDVQEIPLQTFAMPAVRPIPEPATSTLIGVGLAVLAAKRREATAGL